VEPAGPHRIGPAAAVVLDIDGTIVEWPSFLNAEFEAARARALGRIRALFPAAAAVDPPVGRNNRELLDALAPALGPAELGAARRIVFAAGAGPEVLAARRVGPRPGAVGALAGLAGAGCALAAVTDSSRAAVGVLRRRFPGLFGRLRAVVTRDDSGALKPDPAGLLLALRALGAAPTLVVAAGDSVADAGAARAAGVRFVGVAGGASTAGELRAAGALAVVDGPRGLARLLVPACAGRWRGCPRGLTEARARPRAGPGRPAPRRARAPAERGYPQHAGAAQQRAADDHDAQHGPARVPARRVDVERVPLGDRRGVPHPRPAPHVRAHLGAARPQAL